MSIDGVQAEVRAELTGPGGMFEIVTEDVRGTPMQVFKNRRRSLAELVDGAAAFGDAEFLVLDDVRITHERFVSLTNALARTLVEDKGIGAGDRVAIFAANRPEWIITFFAVTRVGATVAAMNGWWTTDEAAYSLQLTAPAMVFGDSKRLERIADVDYHGEIVDFDTDFDDLLAGDDTPPEVTIAEDDPALILFTSGTTGRPKGALISHRGLIGFIDGMIYNGAESAFINARSDPDSLGEPRPQLVTLATSPLFHVSGLFGSTLMGIAVGSKLVFRSGRFDPDDVLRLIEQERVTSWGALGSMGPRVLAAAEDSERDLSSVTNVGFGGAPVSEDLQRRLRECFPNAAANFGMGYGSSESVAVITSISGQAMIDHPDSCGRTNLTFEVEIRDDAGNVLPAGVEGEIHVRSPYTMLGYWRNPEATAETIVDGWLATGDIGCFDDGWLTINSRARDMILRAAENVYPVEIENRIDAHPDVVESAVVGVDHPELGQDVKAVVVLTPDATVDAEALTEWCSQSLAPFKVPGEWEIRTEPLPRNAAGKVVKDVLTGRRTLDQHEE